MMVTIEDREKIFLDGVVESQCEEAAVVVARKLISMNIDPVKAIEELPLLIAEYKYAKNKSLNLNVLGAFMQSIQRKDGERDT